MTEKTRKPHPCGTPDAYRAHLRDRAEQRARGEVSVTEIDQACRDAWATYARQRNAGLSQARIPRLSEDEKEQIRLARSGGARLDEIAAEFGVTRSHVKLVCESASV